MFIVWQTDKDNVTTAEKKVSKRAAVIVYNKLATRTDLKECGWSVSEDAYPHVRRAVGLKPFLDLGEKD
jgi:hypothetical protein